MSHFNVPTPWVLIVLTSLIAAPAQAQNAATVAAPTLAQSLALAQPPATGVTLTVNASKIHLPKHTAPPAAGAAISDVAEAYHRLAQDFGTVTALAPPRMTLVYSPPDTPNPYADMPPAQVMQMLTQSFDKAQWDTFMGSHGLGYSDLQTPAQQSLFAALFPSGHLKIEKDNPGGPNDPKTKQDISGPELMQARLRLGYWVSLGLQMANNVDEHEFGADFAPPGMPARYIMLNALSYDADQEYGARVRQTGANSLKHSQLDTSADAFKAPIPLSGIKTVGDLIARIAATTHTEIYADPRYASRTVTLLGPDTSARASDLLQALALCVTGTYRQVGPAFVLTDGLTGIGTKHALWKAFEAKDDAMLPHANTPLSFQNATTPYTVKDISWGDDPMAFTPTEQKLYWTHWLKQGAPQYSNGLMQLTLPFSQLSPDQQEAAELTQQANQNGSGTTTLKGTIMVQAEPTLEISLPSLDGPVIVFQSYQNLLSYPKLSPAEQKIANHRAEAQMAFPFPSPQQAQAKPQPVRPLIEWFARRAVQIAPTTPQEVQVDMTALKTLGFNEIWLQLPTSPQIRSEDPIRPLLKAAVQAGRKDGIAVFPDLSLLHWQAGAPAEFTDLDIEGLTPSEAAKEPTLFMFPAQDTVTPFEPGVAQRLIPWVQAAGSVPGIGGMVWDDMTPIGYGPFQPNGPDMDQGDALGYALAGRLAFLRWAHTDPVDVYTNSYSDERAHVVVPGFNDDFHEESNLYSRWRGLRAQVDQVLMQRLAAALPPAFGNHAGRLPLIVPPTNEVGSEPSVYGSWDNFRGPTPSEQFIIQRGSDGQPLRNVAVTEQMPSALSYHVLSLPIYGMPDQFTENWADNVAAALSQARQRGDANIVLEIPQDPHLLDALTTHGTAALSAPTPGG